MRFERNLITSVPSAPPTLPIPRLIYGNAVNPRPQRGLTTEAMQRSKDSQEDFLRQIEGFVAISEQMAGQPEYHAMVLRNKECTCILVARDTALHEQAFTPRNFSPAGSAGLFHREFPSHGRAISQTISGKG